MKAGGGKAKGAAYEREVCKRLSKWLSNGARDDLLWRSAMSGGRATVQFAQGKVNMSQSGDVTAIADGAFSFCERTYIEIKNYKDLQIGRGLLCGTGSLLQFWNSTIVEAQKYGKRPLLVARQNLYPALALTRIDEPVFEDNPLMSIHHWCAELHLFDEVTKVRIPLRRRA